MICDHKVSGRMWLSIARTAHELGLRSNATMLYGHVETFEERVDHLLKLRELQDQTHGFNAFIPLEFHPANTGLAHVPKPTGLDALKTIAVSRLLLDNFDHIKAYWVMLTPRVAQIALRFGADDLDGTVVEEKIYHDAGATTPEHLTRPELERLIRAAGRVPVERDTLYNRIDRPAMPPAAAPSSQHQRDSLVLEKNSPSGYLKRNFSRAAWARGRGRCVFSGVTSTNCDEARDFSAGGGLQERGDHHALIVAIAQRVNLAAVSAEPEVLH